MKFLFWVIFSFRELFRAAFNDTSREQIVFRGYQIAINLLLVSYISAVRLLPEAEKLLAFLA